MKGELAAWAGGVYLFSEGLKLHSAIAKQRGGGDELRYS